MDVRLTPGMLATLQRALERDGAAPVAPRAVAAAQPVGAGAPTSGVSFSAALGDALKGVSAAQNDSSALQRAFQSGAEGVSLEQTMLAMQKAQIGFQAALTVRNRLVQAYTDVMNMQV
jgi:flagellar hook-basal body complex protein FliE